MNHNLKDIAMKKYDTEKDSGAVKVVADVPKVIPKPIWQAFSGFSYLFDNPGILCIEAGHKPFDQLSVRSAHW